jgi:hypothetical protein
MRTTTFAIILSMFAAQQIAFGAEGKIIKRADLPEAVKAAKSAKKASKFPGIPSCSVGRLETDWSTVMDIGSWDETRVKAHACGSAKTVYVCSAFGKLSVRCE